MTTTKTNIKNEKPLFAKAQLLKAERFKGREDIVNALLLPDKLYTIEAVEEKINNYMKGKVK